MPRVLIVGGGITGLAAAVDLAGEPGYDVELWEGADRLGGKIATSPFAGVDGVDEGADAYLTRVPHAVSLAERVGLGADELTAPSAATAQVWHGRLHDIPDGTLLGVPADLRPFVTSSLLSWHGKLRAAVEPVLPRRDHDDSLGSLVRHRFGAEVHDRLVDALVGSIYATDTDRSSLTAIPQLAQLAVDHRSLLLGARRMRHRAANVPGAPIFAAPRRGMSALVDAAAHHATSQGVRIDTGRPVREVAPDGRRWRVDDEPFDAVVLATPAATTATIVGRVAPESAAALRAIDTADVVLVRLAVAASGWPERLHGRSGYLVPKSQQRYVTAASFGSQKWAHWNAADGSQILRVSLGRDGLPVADLDDDAVIRHVVDEVGAHLGIHLAPTATSITRWFEAFPQYRPHHHRRVDAIEAALPAGLVVAGASYRGIGIPACVSDGWRASRRVKEATGSADESLS